MMGKWDYPQKKKSPFSQTLLRGFRAIGICLLCLAGVTALAMGAVIAFMDACGVWSFEWRYKAERGDDVADMDKVIKGLQQHCEGSMFDRCGECPYYEVADEPFQCRDALLLDALALLKEQNDNIGHWVVLENCSNAGVYCSECHTKIFDRYPMKKKYSYFCPHCGTRMEGQVVKQDG